MPDTTPTESDLLRKINALIEGNISSEQFGVAELADQIGMSRSNLLRKVKALTHQSVSQYVREFRLKKAMERMKDSSLNVSEISYQFGFGSVSYFIKCFREYYGYPPGEIDRKYKGIQPKPEQGLSSRSHQLVAIMFTDIEGYTALMQRDETQAIAFRTRHREVFNSVTKKYKGRILQYYGDGTLSTFPSAVDAVQCGIEMQLAFRDGPVIPVRIGIHSGDIISTDEEIIGDGVNVASRIESLALAGTVYISEKVHDEIKNQPDIESVSMGKFELKNVDKPLEVFAVSGYGLPSVQKSVDEPPVKNQKDWKKWMAIPVLIALVFVSWLIFDKYGSSVVSGNRSTAVNLGALNKSIAVLPFINDSNDSSNVYIINGLMESTLNNLQKIKDLRVISRMSVERYRNNPKSITEIGKELNVHYIIEGSGQKIGNQILLSIQLIDATNDHHIWSEQYKREVTDIFDLQSEIAKSITERIQVIITPDEEERINQRPTDNLTAYDFFMKAQEYYHMQTDKGYLEAISLFKKAIDHDPGFAHVYAQISISYYFLDVFQTEKRYGDEINHFADQALLLDDKLPQSLMAKGLYYFQIYEYEMGISYFEKALEYNPNSSMVIKALSDVYSSIIPDTEKYLKYALRGISLDIGSNDSASTSITYLHLSNAFMQSGFLEKAEKYINISLNYDPDNIYSDYLKAYILLAKDKNFQRTRELLLKTLAKDTTRIDVIQEIAKISYYQRDYETANMYYQKLLDIKATYGLELYTAENAKIAVVFNTLGKKEEAKQMMTAFKEYADNDQSIYKDLSLAAYYSYHGNIEKSLEHLRMFSKQESFFYRIVLFLKDDPLFDNVVRMPEFAEISKTLDKNFWLYHEKIKRSLEKEGVI